MDLRLSGKTAVVTGAGRGIGLATVRALTAEGMRVVAASRTAPPEPAETGAINVAVDLADPGGPARLIGPRSPSWAASTSWSTTSAVVTAAPWAVSWRSTTPAGRRSWS